ncbi:MAG: DUF5995 family protein [Blastocatellia bacterium]
MNANTIDEVIAQLTGIIDRSRRESDRLGYFAALYRKVTIRVKEGIEQGRFEDGPRMERLDVNFANRCLEACELHRRGEPATESWRVCFEAAGHWRPIILQHLLLGMNAHINLDLGIAAVETCPGDQLPPLQNDFDKINDVLAELVQPVQDELGGVSPWIGFLEKIDPRAGDAIVSFSMDRARVAAWNFAVKLNSLPPTLRAGAIQARDLDVAALGRLVRKPGRFLLPVGLLAIRLRESGDVPRVIDALAGPPSE